LQTPVALRKKQIFRQFNHQKPDIFRIYPPFSTLFHSFFAYFCRSGYWGPDPDNLPKTRKNHEETYIIPIARTEPSSTRFTSRTFELVGGYEKPQITAFDPWKGPKRLPSDIE
jgi:hypothetical protein